MGRRRAERLARESATAILDLLRRPQRGPGRVPITLALKGTGDSPGPHQLYLRILNRKRNRRGIAMLRLRIERDDSPSNPRTEFDHLGTIVVCGDHTRRCVTGDENHTVDLEDHLAN